MYNSKDIHAFRQPTRSTGEHQVRKSAPASWSDIDKGNLPFPDVLDYTFESFHLPRRAGLLHQVKLVLGEADLLGDEEHGLKELCIDKETGDFGEL